MPQYMLSVIHDWDDTSMTPEQMQEAFEAVDAFNNDITAKGQWVFGGGLEHPETARVVDGVKGADVVTDGPYLEAKEHLGGFWVIEVGDLDEAVAIGRRASAACAGKVEVRPFQAEPDDAQSQIEPEGE